VSTPAFTLNVSFTSGTSNYSSNWGKLYQLPLTLTHGGYWNVSITGTIAGTYSTWFYVHTYGVQLYSDANQYLPGHAATVTWDVRASANNARLNQISTVQSVAWYISRAGVHTNDFPTSPRNLAALATGSTSVGIPTDIPTGGLIHVIFWVNQTSTGGTNSEQSVIVLTAAALGVPTTYLGTCSQGCPAFTLPANSIVFVRVTQMLVGGFFSTPAVNLNVHVSFSANGVAITSVPGNPALVQTTNASGGVALLFLANPLVFSTTHPNQVSLNLSDPLYAKTAHTVNLTFFVQAVVPGVAALSLVLAQSQYYSGDTLTGNWAIGGSNATASQGWQADSWFIFDSNTGGLLATGNVTTTANSGSFKWPIPATWVGIVDAVVQAHNASSTLSSSASAFVTQPLILLTASELYYLPGDTVTITVATEGSAFTGATFYGSAVSGFATVWSGVISGGSISLNIPKVSPPTFLTVSVAAQSPTGGLVSSTSLTLYEVSGFQLTAGVSTPSQYEDGSYQPGQTVQIHYAIVPYGLSSLPKAFRISVYPNAFAGSGVGAKVFSTTSASGAFSYTIPAGLASGAQLIELLVQFSACSGYCATDTLFSILIESTPPALGYELGAGSGVTVGWVILLVLILLVALVGYWKMRGRKRPVVMSPTTSGGSSGGSGSNAGSRPSEPSPPSWTEEKGPSETRATDTHSGSPPLPYPPGGR
jgi:hypothetical protein